MEKEVENVCSVCYKKFTAKKNLLKHLRDVHKNFKEAERMVVKKIKCPESDCCFMCRMMKELRDHIEGCHNVKILKDVLQFTDETVFQKWKKEEESNTVSWFVTGRKKTTLTDGTKKQTLCCHRTGHYSPKGFGKYRMRSVGSCKIGVTCPASMEVTEFPDGQLNVVYYKTHLGHRQDVVHLKLSREERTNLAEKIEQGFTFDSILDDIRESADLKNLQTTKRIHLLSKKDLYSIMRSANGNQGKKIKKESNCADKTTENGGIEKVDGLVPSSANIVGNVAMLKIDKNVQQNFTLYPGEGVILPQGYSLADETSLSKCEKTTSVPYGSNTSLSPQIVILSRDIDCTSVAEIIFLSAGETVVQSRLPSENKIPTVEESKPENLTNSSELTLEEKNKMNKTNLRLQLKEKLDRIAGLLPQAEHLTPKQFALVSTKLDAVLNMFNMADGKAKMRAKRKGAKKMTQSDAD